jgi:hypothetical protein
MVSASANLEYVRSEADTAQLLPFRPNQFVAMGAQTITYTYTVAADAVPGAAFRLDVTNLIGGDEQGAVTPWDDIFATGTVAAPPTAPPTTAPPTTAPPTTAPPTTTTPPGGNVDDSHKVGDIEGSATPFVIAGIAVLVVALGIFGYVKLK